MDKDGQIMGTVHGKAAMGGNVTNSKDIPNGFRAVPDWNRGTREAMKEGLDVGAERAWV